MKRTVFSQGLFLPQRGPGPVRYIGEAPKDAIPLRNDLIWARGKIALDG